MTERRFVVKIYRDDERLDKTCYKNIAEVHDAIEGEKEDYSKTLDNLDPGLYQANVYYITDIEKNIQIPIDVIKLWKIESTSPIQAIRNTIHEAVAMLMTSEKKLDMLLNKSN